MEIITLTPENLPEYGFCSYKDEKKHKEMTRKADWYNTYYPKGLRIKVLLSPDDGSQVIDKKKPDFQLMGLNFNSTGNPPRFLDATCDKYSDGLFILRSPQCPYTEKNVRAMA